MTICGGCCEEEEKRERKNGGRVFIGCKTGKEGGARSTKTFGVQGTNH
jgi:hypothetical protein